MIIFEKMHNLLSLLFGSVRVYQKQALGETKLSYYKKNSKM